MRRSIDLGTHVVEARIEDAQFLLDNGCEMEEVARRLGVKENTLIQELRRHARRGEPDTGEPQRPGEDP